MCEIGRRVWLRQYVAANDGNFSLRLGDNHLLCTPTCVSKGFMRPEQLAVIDFEMNQISGPIRVTSEIRMHLAIYAQRTDVQAIVHTHSPAATGFAVAHRELPTGILPEIEINLGVIPTVAYETPGTDAFADSVGQVAREHDAMLLENHGLVTVGDTLEQAYFRMESVEHYCNILLAASKVGGWQTIPGDKRKPLASRRELAEWNSTSSGLKSVQSGVLKA